MNPDNEKESFEDAIRADIRREILSSTSRRNRYSEQIAQIHREEEERKRSARGRSRRTEKPENIPVRKNSKEVEQASLTKKQEYSERVDHARYKKSEKKRRQEEEAQDIMDDLKSGEFWKGYVVFCGILMIFSGIFLSYVWRSIRLYESTRPEYLVEQEIERIQSGDSVDNIFFPKLEENQFSSVETMKDGYIEKIQKGDLTYRFAKENYQTGDKEYFLYDGEEPVAKMTLQTMKSEKRLGILPITKMQVQCIEPIMNILVWDYDIETLDSYHVYINDVEVPASYLDGEASEIQEFRYLYEYVDLPRVVNYHVEGIYKEAEIKITDEQGREIAYQIDGNKIIATEESLIKEESLDNRISEQLDPLQAAKTWSLFTTRDLAGANYGLEQVRAYFIKDSYYWQKLGEYANGIDITLVSDHNASATFFTEENVSEYCMLGEDCFSCRISFQKHMKLNVGKEQIDKTDSNFYFVRVDDTDDNVDNPTWKIADIQAVVNQ